MDDLRPPRPPALALEHMTGPVRGSVTWLTVPALNVTLEKGCYLHISEPGEEVLGDMLVARLRRVQGTYEIEAIAGCVLWVNREAINLRRLTHGDVIEFGDTGPLCRCRVYSDETVARNSVTDIIGDIGAYLRTSRQPRGRRLVRAMRALFERLSRETSLLFRSSVLAAFLGFGALAYQQIKLNSSLQREIELAAGRLDSVAISMVNAQKAALRPKDLILLRETLEKQVTSNLTRVEELEMRITASGRVIAASSPSVAFLQGAYGVREREGERMLRQVIRDDGVPQLSARGWPMLSFDGEGPVVELQYTGTGFIVDDGRLLITNRHVALPWEQSAGGLAMGSIGEGEPTMIRLLAYLPNLREGVPVRLLLASDGVDLAILQRDGPIDDAAGMMPALRLAELPPTPGDEVIVMGYPTGLRTLLAQSGADFVKKLQVTGKAGFWDIGAQLAESNRITPLASRGIVGQVSAAAVVYDAETTHGGSGGPVLNAFGDVIAVNSAILPEYGGSNIGVPVENVRSLLAQARAR